MSILQKNRSLTENNSNAAAQGVDAIPRLELTLLLYCRGKITAEKRNEATFSL
jgi:hypothetical protein